ncbi:phytanoyl-CoA dioxygenase family protein [Methylocaldum sp. MU1018]
MNESSCLSGSEPDPLRLEQAARKSPANAAAAPLFDPITLRKRFRRDGYVIVSGAVPQELCRAAVAAFERTVKPSRDFFVRHESGRYQRHVFTEHGFMAHPILNIQDLSPHKFGEFSRLGLDILTQKSIQRIAATLLRENVCMIRTKFFDGSRETWVHRDGHDADFGAIGSMLGVWIAAEDVHPEAGRFYVYEGSHRVPAAPRLRFGSLNPDASPYRNALAAWAEESGFRRVAPALRQGDAVLWSSLTIHGSFAATDPARSRRCFTAHYIPESSHGLWLRRARGSVGETVVNGVRVSRHGDQGRWAQQTRAAFSEYLAARHPDLFRSLKRLRKGLSRAGGPMPGEMAEGRH